MPRVRIAIALLCWLPLVAAAGRPPARVVVPAASPVDTMRVADGRTEGAAFLAGLDPKLRTTLEKERLVVLGEPGAAGGSFAGYVRAYVLFRQPKRRTFELLAEPSRQLQFLPRLTLAKAVERPQHGEVTRFRLEVMFTTTDFQVRHWFYPEASRLEWLLDPAFDNDIRAQEGFWQLYQVDAATTVAEYGSRVETGLPVPASLQDYFARRDIPLALAATRRFVDSGGTWRRDD